MTSKVFIMFMFTLAIFDMDMLVKIVPALAITGYTINQWVVFRRKNRNTGVVDSIKQFKNNKQDEQ